MRTIRQRYILALDSISKAHKASINIWTYFMYVSMSIRLKHARKFTSFKWSFVLSLFFLSLSLHSHWFIFANWQKKNIWSFHHFIKIDTLIEKKLDFLPVERNYSRPTSRCIFLATLIYFICFRNHTEA